MDTSSDAPVPHGPIHEMPQQRSRSRIRSRSTSLLPVTLLFSSPLTIQSRNLVINKNPFLPDYGNTLCKNDKPADPWMKAVAATAEACCKLNFSWNLAACQLNSGQWALKNAPETPEEDDEVEEVIYTKFWADTSEGICKLDGPDRPSWVTAYDIPYEKCCEDHLSWSVERCFLAKPKLPVSTSSKDKKYYPDEIKGYCKEDGPKRPSWIDIIEDDYVTCCTNHFNETEQSFDKCMRKMPADATTKKPTGVPSVSPTTPAPVPDLWFTPAPEASNPTTAPPTTLRPSSRPTSNVVCSDQSLNKDQCESNPKCVWYLKRGIACTYKAWVEPTARPTPYPTYAPVISYEFYHVPGSGICAFNDEAKPAWIKEIYTDWDECCQEESWDIPKCLAAKPDELKESEMEMQSSSTGGSKGRDDYVIIDITMYGSMVLDEVILPDATSEEWADFKRVLTKSMILTLAYDTELVHPNVEVELWSIGSEQFTWRRALELLEDAPSSLRGSQGERRVRKNKKTNMPTSRPTKPTNKPKRYNKKTKKPTSKPVLEMEENSEPVVSSEPLGERYELKFAIVVPTKCDRECQNSNSHLGKAEADLIEEHLQDFVANNYFRVQLKREGKAVGLFLDSLPVASDVSLDYRFATKSGGGLTWSPSFSPTRRPTLKPTPSPSVSTSPTSSARPSDRLYYPDYENHICKVADGTEPEFEVNYFPSLKKCCKFEWIDFKNCMNYSFTDPPTPGPTGKPTLRPTKAPKTRRPTPKPTVKMSPAPTRQPIKLNSAPIGSSGGIVYYPDLYLGVCKSDGKHGDIPYTFSTPDACCNNNYMDYYECMAYASPKRYFPNPWVGYCQEADESENSMYIFSTPQECCETGMVGEYDTCVTNTFNQSGPGPTPNPTRAPAGPSLPGNYYPDFSVGFCRSDGGHGDKPYVFVSAEKCCRNAIMKYDECVFGSIQYFGIGAPTTPEPTNKPSKRPSSRPSKRPTNEPTSTPTVLGTSPFGSYYPDFTSGFCKSDGNHENKPFVFATAENCCENDIMEYDTCLFLSIQNFQPAPSPFGSYYPDFTSGFCKSDGNQENEPFVFTSAEKCCKNDIMEYETCLLLSIQNFQPPSTTTTTSTTSTTTTTTTTKIFYPDFRLKVCKSDGNHQGSPYIFSSALACCDNSYMDYNRCVSYAAGYTYLPVPLEGHCRVSTKGTESIAYKYNSPEECCESGIMGDYDDCVLSSLERLSGGSTEHTTTSTTTTVKKVYYPDLVLKVCKSDGQQGKIPYLFSSAEECCDNNYMDYDTCIAYTQGSSSASLPTTTTSTTTYSNNKVFYPDLVLKVCKSDGKHGQIPFLFSTAHECCSNKLMDYDSCIAYANDSTSVIDTTTTTSTSVNTPAPVTPLPTGRPTPKPTEKFTPPPVISAAIDARQFTNEVTDGFEKGLDGVFPWSTTPNQPWTIDKIKFNEGSASARSAPISKGETSDLYVAVNSDHGGTFYFSMKSDVQMPYSGFYVNVDNKSKAGYTFPTAEWRDLSVTVEAGQHVLMFRTWVPSSASGPSPTTTGTVNIDKVSFQPHLIEDFESEALAWQSNEFVDNDWVFDTSNPHAGNVALCSPDLNSGQRATMKFEFTTPSKGSKIEFWAFPRLNGRDKFEFKIDGFDVVGLTNAQNTWKIQSKSLVPGRHTLEWSFIKSSGDASSKIWIDDIRILPFS